MNTLATVWIIILTGLFMIALAFPLLIFPVLAFVDCVRNKNLPTQSKIAWGCLILFTWVLGAALYGIVATRRPFYRTMGFICAFLFVAALIAKKPLARYQEKQKAELEARKQSLNAQQQASYKTEWERYKPIYDAFGMNEVWTSYEAGRCEEGKQVLAIHRDTYRQSILNRERQSTGKPLSAIELNQSVDKMMSVPDKGYEMCIRIKESTSAGARPTPASSQSVSDVVMNSKASNSLSKLGQIRTNLAKYYGYTHGRYPAKLEELVGKEGTPTLILPDHPESREIVIYTSDLCGGTLLNKIDPAKLKDTGKWGYVADPKAECYGTAFIDCTHANRVSGKHWNEY